MTDQQHQLVTIYDQGRTYLCRISGNPDVPLHELVAQGKIEIVEEKTNGRDDRTREQREETP
jgi:hypothetical protein